MFPPLNRAPPKTWGSHTKTARHTTTRRGVNTPRAKKGDNPPPWGGPSPPQCWPPPGGPCLRAGGTPRRLPSPRVGATKNFYPPPGKIVFPPQRCPGGGIYPPSTVFPHRRKVFVPPPWCVVAPRKQLSRRFLPKGAPPKIFLGGEPPGKNFFYPPRGSKPPLSERGPYFPTHCVTPPP